MGASFTDGDHYTAKSAADLSTKRFYICKTDSTGKVVLSSAATDKHLGVISDGGRVSGDNVDVQLINGSGTYKVIVGAGGAVAKDDYITSDSAGKAVTTTTAGDRVIGQAVTAGAVGAQVEYIKKDFKYA